MAKKPVRKAGTKKKVKKTAAVKPAKIKELWEWATGGGADEEETDDDYYVGPQPFALGLGNCVKKNLKEALKITDYADWHYSNLEYRQAIQYYYNAIEYCPSNATTKDNEGNDISLIASLLEGCAYSHIELGNPEGALGEMNRALELAPKSPMIWLSRAKVYKELGDDEKAIADAKKALELNPKSQKGKEFLASLSPTKKSAAGKPASKKPAAKKPAAKKPAAKKPTTEKTATKKATASKKPAPSKTQTSLSFCFTGELMSMKRKEAEAKVKALGAQVKTTVAKGLSYLVTNDTESGSSKNKKAAELGIPVINEKKFLALLGKMGK